MAEIKKLDLNWKNNQSPALNKDNLNAIIYKINEVIDVQNINQPKITSIPRTTNDLINNNGFVTQDDLGRTRVVRYVGLPNAISKNINVGFYPSYVQIIETSSTGVTTGAYTFSTTVQVLGDYSISFINSGVEIYCVAGGTFNKEGYSYTVQCRFEWDFHSSAKPILTQLTRDAEDTQGEITVDLKDNYIYYINGYKKLTFNPPLTGSTYNCYVYITLSNESGYIPSITLPTYVFGDDISLINPGNSLELSIDGLGGILFLNKGTVL